MKILALPLLNSLMKESKVEANISAAIFILMKNIY